MVRINKDNIDSYYEDVNNKIDSYLGKNISANALETYFKKGGYGITRFIEREGLSEVENIEKVILDCVTDRVALTENVLTFESFELEYDTNNKINIDYEVSIQARKVIADFYNTSLGHIQGMDKSGKVYDDLDTNFIRVSSVGSEKFIYVFKSNDVRLIMRDLAKYSYTNFMEQKLSLPSFDISMGLSGLVDESIFMENMESHLSKDFTKYLGEIITMNTGDEYKKVSFGNGVLIYERV